MIAACQPSSTTSGQCACSAGSASVSSGQLARLVKERQFRPGVEVVKEGTMSGVGFFIVAEGEASVSVDGEEVARIGPGGHFGELALLSGDARAATVTAVTRLRCHVIAFWDFRKFAKEHRMSPGSSSSTSPG